MRVYQFRHLGRDPDSREPALMSGATLLPACILVNVMDYNRIDSSG